MPYVNKPRPYKRENRLYKSKPEQIKLRVERNKARREALAAGLVHKGDGKEVDHVKPLSLGGSNAKSNRRVISSTANRSYPRQANHKPKP